jgi:hypothetical protein
MRKDLIIGIILFLLAVCIRLPLFGQPHVSDPLEYVKITDNVYEKNLYSLDGETLFNRKPPLFIYSAVIVNYFVNNVDHAVKISAIFWGSLVILLSYYFARNCKLNRRNSIIVSLLIMFNPWLYYVGGGNMTYPEGMLTCFIMCGLYFYKNQNTHKYYIWIAGTFFGLTPLVKTHALIFTVTFVAVHILYDIIKNKDFLYLFHWKNILFAFLVIFGQLLFTIRNLLVTSSVSDYYGLFHLIKYWPYMMILYIFFMLPLLLFFNIIHIYYGAKKMWIDRFWKTFLISAGIYIILLSVVTHHGTFFTIITSKVRYLLILFPYLMILAFKANKPKFLYNKKILILTVIGTMFYLLIINFGAIQLQISGFPVTYQQKAHLRDWAIQKTNDIALDGASVIGDFVEPEGDMRGSAYFLDEQLRSDLVAISPEKFECKENIYIISEMDLETLSEKYLNCKFEILESNHWITIYGIEIQ